MSQKYAIRSMVRARKGHKLIQCDLSAAEAWCVAFLAHDENMKKGLAGDLHTLSARIIFELSEDTPVAKDSIERYLGKKWNHSSNYMAGPEQLAKGVNGDSDQPPYVTITVAQARQYYTRWHSFYRVKDWWQTVEDRIKATRTITTIYRRKRKFYGFLSKDMLKEAVAFGPQSIIADHMLGHVQPEIGIPGGLLHVYRTIVEPSRGEIRCLNTSHDSAILEVPNQLVSETAERFVDCLYRPMIIEGEELYVPVDCEIGERWAEGMEKIKIPLQKKSYELTI